MNEGVSTATCDPPQSRAKETLQQHLVPGLRRVHVELNESEVIISGTVSSYYLKQVAQEALKSILGIRTLNNRVEVKGPFRKAGPWEA
jgi:osmotically-inducible protein OsmY